MIQGLACNLESDAFKLLHKATLDVRGKSEPFSLCGSLPLVGDLKEAGFDVMVSVTTYQPLHSVRHTYILFVLLDVWLWSQSCVSWRQ